MPSSKVTPPIPTESPAVRGRRRQRRRRAGKSDTHDAVSAARAAFAGDALGAPKTRDGNVEAIRDGLTGLLVPPEDAEALGAACLALLADPVRREAIADAARAEAGERFGEAKHADAIMDAGWRRATDGLVFYRL